MMTPEIQRLVGAICPDFPIEKQVKSSHDQFSWFKIIHATNTLVIPPLNYVKSNMLMLDKTVEAITAFAYSEQGAPEYDWDNLNLYEASDPEGILKLLAEVRKVAQGDVALDIETRRVEWEDNKLLSIGFATDENTCYAIYNIPIPGASGFDLPSNNSVEFLKVYHALQDLLGATDLNFIWHNGKFDCSRLK
jgi:hypothetical protein